MGDSEEEKSESKSAPKPGKWAAEIYDVFRLFSRINRTVYGLLLLEIGWALFVILVGKLPSPDDHSAHEISFPWFGTDGRPSLVQVSASALFVPGALALFFWWGVWSGCSSYLLMPMRRLGNAALLFTMYFLIPIIVLLELLLLLPAEVLLETFWVRRLDQKRRGEIIAKAKAVDRDKLASDMTKQALSQLQENNPAKRRTLVLEYSEKLISALESWDNLTEEDRQLTIKEIGQIAAKRTERKALSDAAIQKFKFSQRPRELCVSIIRRITSQATIAFAPLASFNYLEDLNAAKAPAQVFAVAVAFIRWKLKDQKSSRLVRFRNLPPHWAPRDNNGADRLRRLAGADALIWGTYLTQNVNKIWMYIESKGVRWRPEANKDQDTSRLPALFPYSVDIPPIIVVDQLDLREIYIVCIMALVQLINARGEKRSFVDKTFGSSRSGVPMSLLWRLSTIVKSFDELYMGTGEIDNLTRNLVLEAFLTMPASTEGAEDSMYPSAGRTLLAIAGSWVGNQIHKAESIEDNLPNRLQPVIEKCIAIDETVPENLYRLGALECLGDRPQDAIDAFSKAKVFDQMKVKPQDWAYAHAVATTALNTWDRRSSDAIKLAQFAAECARAINLGGEFSREKLKRDYESTLEVRSMKFSPEREPPTAMKVIEHMFSHDYLAGAKKSRAEPLIEKAESIVSEYAC